MPEARWQLYMRLVVATSRMDESGITIVQDVHNKIENPEFLIAWGFTRHGVWACFLEFLVIAGSLERSQVSTCP